MGEIRNKAYEKYKSKENVENLAIQKIYSLFIYLFITFFRVDKIK